MRKVRHRIEALLLTAVLVLLAGCSDGTGAGSGGSAAVSKESYYFDTVCRISVYEIDGKPAEEKQAQAIIEEAFEACASYEALLSKTVEGSDIWNINHAGGEPVECDPLTVEVIRKGIEYGQQTGIFDITIGKAEDLYDFHAEEHEVPSEEALAEAVKSIDYRQIEIEGNQVRLTLPGGEIDLGGIGKGYIADRISEVLTSRGVTSAIISLGGNLAIVGGKPSGEDGLFRVGIETPFSNQSQVLGVTRQKDATVVTSGIYERYFEKDGKFYHHILDPKTGKPAETDLYGVTIVSSLGHSADCDALATICLMLGSAKGKAFIEGLDGYEALFVDQDGKITMTAGMDFEEAKG